ncbi:MAG: STAS/SEC14 domain-containing protein [Methanosarcina mazei]
MIEPIPGLPENVVAVTASGVLTGEDYERVLVPDIEEKVKKYGKIRLLYQLNERFEGFTDKAMFEDATIGIRHITDFERIAVISDVEWIINAVKIFEFIIPGSVRVYRNKEFPEAKAWISE